MFGIEAGDTSLGLEGLLGVNEDVGRLPLETAERLMDVEAGVRQRRALAGLPGHQEKRAHGPGGPDAKGADGRLDELHRVVHRKPAGHDPAIGIDVEVDRLLRVVGLEEQQLRTYQRRRLVVDLAGQKDDALPSRREKMSKERSPRLDCSRTSDELIVSRMTRIPFRLQD